MLNEGNDQLQLLFLITNNASFHLSTSRMTLNISDIIINFDLKKITEFTNILTSLKGDTFTDKKPMSLTISSHNDFDKLESPEISKGLIIQNFKLTCINHEDTQYFLLLESIRLAEKKDHFEFKIKKISLKDNTNELLVFS